MTEFTVHMANRPGMLAQLTEVFAFHGVHIEALSAYGMDEEAYVRIVVQDEAAARRALRKAGLSATERSILTTIISHEPGALAKLTRSLAESGVNIDALYLLNSTVDGQEFAVVVNDTETASRRLRAI
ncbi:MAG: ACT domain-containing protein [Acidimicrobiia bacterium]|nr:ACT domain-containing protein [Acidimicrobiia bacterium]